MLASARQLDLRDCEHPGTQPLGTSGTNDDDADSGREPRVARRDRSARRGAGDGRGLDVNVHFDRGSVWRAALVLAGVGVGLLLFLWLFSMLSHFLFLLVLAWLFATALEPGIRWLVQRGRSRGVATALVGGSAVLLALGLAVVFGQLFFNQVTDFVKRPARPDDLGDRLGQPPVQDQPRPDHDRLEAAPRPLADRHVGRFPVRRGARCRRVPVVGPVRPRHGAGVRLLLRRRRPRARPQPRLVDAAARARRSSSPITEITIAKTGGYVVSKIVLAAASAFFHGIFFAAIGVPYWLPFALFAGITSQFVPIVGTYLGVILPALATVFDSPWKAVAIIAFAAVYQQVETYYFTPRVSERTMDVNPAIALGAVFVGAAIWGPLGALIGIPLAAAGVAILDTYSHRYELVPDVLNVGDMTDEPEPN